MRFSCHYRKFVHAHTHTRIIRFANIKKCGLEKGLAIVESSWFFESLMVNSIAEWDGQCTEYRILSWPKCIYAWNVITFSLSMIDISFFSLHQILNGKCFAIQMHRFFDVSLFAILCCSYCCFMCACKCTHLNKCWQSTDFHRGVCSMFILSIFSRCFCK